MEDVDSARERTLTQNHGDRDETQHSEKYLWMCSRSTEEEEQD
jgi:hypothetical protein